MQQRGALNLKVQTDNKNVELFITNLMNTAKSPVHNQGSTPLFCPPPTHPPYKKLQKALGGGGGGEINKQHENNPIQKILGSLYCQQIWYIWLLFKRWITLTTGWISIHWIAQYWFSWYLIYAEQRSIWWIAISNIFTTQFWTSFASDRLLLSFTITGHCTLPKVNQSRSNRQCTPS